MLNVQLVFFVLLELRMRFVDLVPLIIAERDAGLTSLPDSMNLFTVLVEAVQILLLYQLENTAQELATRLRH